MHRTSQQGHQRQHGSMLGHDPTRPASTPVPQEHRQDVHAGHCRRYKRLKFCTALPFAMAYSALLWLCSATLRKRRLTLLFGIWRYACNGTTSLWLSTGMSQKLRLTLLLLTWQSLQQRTTTQLAVATMHRFYLPVFRLLRSAFSALRWHALHCWDRDSIALHSLGPALQDFDSHVWFRFLRMLTPHSIRQMRAVSFGHLRNTSSAQHRLAVHICNGRPALVWLRARGQLLQLAPRLPFDPATAQHCVVEFL